MVARDLGMCIPRNKIIAKSEPSSRRLKGEAAEGVEVVVNRVEVEVKMEVSPVSASEPVSVPVSSVPVSVPVTVQEEAAEGVEVDLPVSVPPVSAPVSVTVKEEKGLCDPNEVVHIGECTYIYMHIVHMCCILDSHFV